MKSEEWYNSLEKNQESLVPGCQDKQLQEVGVHFSFLFFFFMLLEIKIRKVKSPELVTKGSLMLPTVAV